MAIPQAGLPGKYQTRCSLIRSLK